MFTDVERIEWQNEGWVPNDLVNSIDVVEEADGITVVELSIDAVRNDASRKETRLRIACRALHLEDPTRPGVKIT